jgi:hypothetical protein
MENGGVAPLILHHWMDESGYIPNPAHFHPGKGDPDTH